MPYHVMIYSISTTRLYYSYKYSEIDIIALQYVCYLKDSVNGYGRPDIHKIQIKVITLNQAAYKRAFQ